MFFKKITIIFGQWKLNGSGDCLVGPERRRLTLKYGPYKGNGENPILSLKPHCQPLSTKFCWTNNCWVLTSSDFYSIQTKKHTQPLLQIHRRFLQTISQFTLAAPLSLSRHLQLLSSALHKNLVIAAMAQSAATGLIHGEVSANPASGSLQRQADKLRPSYVFQTKVLGRAEKKSRPGVRTQTAGRFVRSEMQVIPMSPEDAPKVSSFVCSVSPCVFVYILKYGSGPWLFLTNTTLFRSYSDCKPPTVMSLLLHSRYIVLYEPLPFCIIKLGSKKYSVCVVSDLRVLFW